MDKMHKPGYSECYTRTSEPFKSLHEYPSPSLFITGKMEDCSCTTKIIKLYFWTEEAFAWLYRCCHRYHVILYDVISLQLSSSLSTSLCRRSTYSQIEGSAYSGLTQHAKICQAPFPCLLRPRSLVWFVLVFQFLVGTTEISISSMAAVPIHYPFL
jgi:hypothetical protein